MHTAGNAAAKRQGAGRPPRLSRREWAQRAGALGLGLALGACSGQPERLEALMAQVQGIAAGNPAGKAVMVFFDTRCGYCARLWQGLQAQQNDLAMLWVPVALLSKASEHEALAMLASSSPAEALAQHMAQFGRQAPVAPLPEGAGRDGLLHMLAGNRKVLNTVASGRESVPQSVAESSQGLRVASGARPWGELKKQLAL